jgi:glycosyltransferase involved in cell wall biosynthesis
MKKILWLCNMVLPDFSHEFGIKKNNFGGWMTGLLHGLENVGEINISLCFPIMDRNRVKDGKCNGHNYYTFLCDINALSYNEELIEVFEKILDKSAPDIVHIWGTEYPHTTAMILACKRKKILGRVVINIQGLVSICARHYLSGIPEEYKFWKGENGLSMDEERSIFEERGKCEVESIKMIRHIIGRTDWDRACVEAINSDIHYHTCNEVLRDSFYNNIGKWTYEECQKHSIFVSQASYPIKGFHYLLEALPNVIRKFPDTHIYVAGPKFLSAEIKNPYSYYIEMLMRKYNLTEKILFLGNLNEEQMIHQYLKANVFVLSSSIENSPNSLKEARILGVPSITSFVGGTYCGVSRRENTFFYPYDEPEVLAYYICKIFQNRISKKVNKSYFLALNHPSKCIERNVNIYEKIIEGML